MGLLDQNWFWVLILYYSRVTKYSAMIKPHLFPKCRSVETFTFILYVDFKILEGWQSLHLPRPSSTWPLRYFHYREKLYAWKKHHDKRRQLLIKNEQGLMFWKIRKFGNLSKINVYEHKGGLNEEKRWLITIRYCTAQTYIIGQYLLVRSPFFVVISFAK